jgi:hypothetical protein
MALLEDCESIQFSLMLVVDGLVKGTLDPTRARLIIQTLRIAARNAKEARFDDCYYEESEQPMVREVPNYARQYLIEHPEFGPPISDSRSADPRARKPASPCSADTPVRETGTNADAQREAQAEPAQQNVSNGSKESATESAPTEPAAKRRQNTAHAASRGRTTETNPDPEERKKPSDPDYDSSVENSEEYERIKKAEAAIPGALAGNWRDLRTVFEFAGISERNKEAPR